MPDFGIVQPNIIETSTTQFPFFASVILYLVGAYVLVASVLFIIRRYLRKKHRETRGFRKQVLLVTVPKEAAIKKADSSGEMTAQQIQEKIAAAESLFAAVGGIKAEKGIKKWFAGREDEIAFEIVAHEGLVKFFIAVPPKLRNFIEEQVHANYPHAEIEDIEDYNIFSPTGEIVGAFLTLKKKDYFPLKTYRKLEIDPLSNITNALATVGAPDGAAVQIIIRPAKPGWGKRGSRVASYMHQGLKLGAAESKARGGLTEITQALKTKKKEEPGKDHRLSALEEEMAKGIEEKVSKAGLETTIRVIACGKSAAEAGRHLNDMINAWNQFNIYEYGNTLQKIEPRNLGNFIRSFIYRDFDEKKKSLFNAEEAASAYHLPGYWIETPNIFWLMARHAAPPVGMPKQGIVLGWNEYRGIETIVKIKRPDRRRHMYIVGRSGVGKSQFMEQMAIQDIQNGEGVCIVDPHGDFVEHVLPHIPVERAEDVILFDPSDVGRPVGINMLEAGTSDQKDMAAQEMVSIFYELFGAEMIGPMFEHNMRNVMLTLMSDDKNPGTVAEIPRMFTDAEFQKQWVKKVTDPVVRAFWEKEMAKTSDFHKSEMLGYLISKVGRFVENEMMRNIIGQTHSAWSFREVMDKKKILLINLSKGKTGDVNARLLGLIIVSKLTMAALSRADLPEEKRDDFYLYIDEFQNFITDSVSTILSEARKYKLNLVIAHQYMGQLAPKGDTKIRDAVLGNAGTMAAFRIGIEDAEILEKEFAPTFNAYDLVNVAKYTAYLKLLIDNTAAKPFNIHTYPPQPGNNELAAALKQLSRLKYGRDRAIVESEILERSQLGASIVSPNFGPEKST